MKYQKTRGIASLASRPDKQ